MIRAQSKSTVPVGKRAELKNEAFLSSTRSGAGDHSKVFSRIPSTHPARVQENPESPSR